MKNTDSKKAWSVRRGIFPPKLEEVAMIIGTDATVELWKYFERSTLSFPAYMEESRETRDRRLVSDWEKDPNMKRITERYGLSRRQVERIVGKYRDRVNDDVG